MGEVGEVEEVEAGGWMEGFPEALLEGQGRHRFLQQQPTTPQRMTAAHYWCEELLLVSVWHCLRWPLGSELVHRLLQFVVDPLPLALQPSQGGLGVVVAPNQGVAGGGDLQE